MARATARYRITADDSQATRALKRVRRGFAETAKSALGFRAQLFAVAGAAGLGAMVKSTLKTADEIGKLSRQYDVSTELLSEMRGVLNLTGGEFDQFTKGIKTASVRMLELERGTKTATDDFEALGITLEEIEGLNTEQRIFRIVDALSKMTAGSERTAIAQNVLGRSSKTFLRLADAGVDTIAKLREEQVKLGNSFSSDMTTQAERANDALEDIRATLQGLVQSGILEWAGDLARFLGAISDSIGLISGRVDLNTIAQPTVQTGEAFGPAGPARFARNDKLAEQLLRSSERQEGFLSSMALGAGTAFFGG